MIPEAPSSAMPVQRGSSERKQTFSKVFRWHLPAGQTREPGSVEVVGTFTHWQRVPLLHDGAMGGWHVTLHHIEGNRTHHYMLLVDGQPTYDKMCDGTVAPHGSQEEKFQLMTERGPRVFMLFAQTR